MYLEKILLKSHIKIKLMDLKYILQDLINKNLINLISKTKNKEVFLSTGGSTLREISYAVSIFKKKRLNLFLCMVTKAILHQ